MDTPRFTPEVKEEAVSQTTYTKFVVKNIILVYGPHFSFYILRQG